MVYLPEHDEASPQDAAVLIADRPLATLVTFGAHGLAADHVPLLLESEDGSDRLIGHVARANPLWHPGRHDGESLAVFGGADHYVSPTWYPSKGETHEVVPTWNYLVAHVYGELVVHDDPKWVRGAVAKLTTAMERGRQDPWRMAQAPADYIGGRLQDIVGIELRIARLIGKFKVSATRTPADRGGAADGIEAASGGSSLVDAMRRVSARGD